MYIEHSKITDILENLGISNIIFWVHYFLLKIGRVYSNLSWEKKLAPGNNIHRPVWKTTSSEQFSNIRSKVWFRLGLLLLRSTVHLHGG